MQTLLAQASTSTSTGLGTAAAAAGYSSGPPIAMIIGNAISVVLGICGMLFVILLVYAGVLYLTSQGEEGNVKKAKKLITSAVLGIIIIVAAYAITRYLFQALIQVTT
ncbi:hypothetical protein EBS80_02260 [bacterium]|nr:hypothetical protein [bacterium]